MPNMGKTRRMNVFTFATSKYKRRIMMHTLIKRNWIRVDYNLFLYLLLGLLTAFGPFVTDMYLPSLPAMVSYFGTTSSMVQLGLTTSFMGLAVGQVFFGPLSDKYGRRPLLLVAMGLFIASTIICIFAPTIQVFVLFRFIQGVAGAGGIVISRSIATDKFEGKELMRILAIVGAINGIAPVIAPVLGGTLTDSVGWQGIFFVLLIIGGILAAGCVYFKESLPIPTRSKAGLINLFYSFKRVVRNRLYLFYVLQLGFAQGILFSNIASSSFIVQEHYGYSPLAFSICFGVNAIAIGAAAALSVKFRKPENGTLTGCIGMVALSICELIALYLDCNFWVYESLLFMLLFMMGLTFTTSTVLAMNAERKNSGTASAFLGAVCFIFGGIVSPLVGLGNILVSTGILFVVCAVCSLLCAIKASQTMG